MLLRDNSNPPRGSAAEVKKEAWDAMSEEEQQFLEGVATETRRLLKEESPAEANVYLKSQRLDQEETLAVWWLLGSASRSALKK